LAGLPTDFANFLPEIGPFAAVASLFAGFAAPVASATAITATGPRFHVTGTTTIATINPPPGFVQGRITIVFDGVAAWTTGGTSPYAIAVAGTPTTAGSSVDFDYDATTQLWYPTRLA
jgi:hypothetical protein